MLLGSGISLPGPSISNSELLEKIKALGINKVKSCATISRYIGVKTRHLCRDIVQRTEKPRQGDTNPELAARALTEALQNAGINSGDLGYLFGHTSTPHTLLPPNISWVADYIQYSGPYSELRQACTGFAGSLILAAGLLSSNIADHIGIVGSETGSVFFDPRRIEESEAQRVNLMQMGDGAGAVVLGRENCRPGAKIERIFFGSVGQDKCPGIAMEIGGSAMPISSEYDIHQEFFHDFEAVKENGLELFSCALDFIKSIGIELKEIQWILPHQANGYIDTILSKKLELPKEKIVVDCDKLGNLGSASIWVTLHRLRTSGKLSNGDTVLVIGAEASKYLYGGFLYRHAI